MSERTSDTTHLSFDSMRDFAASIEGSFLREMKRHTIIHLPPKGVMSHSLTNLEEAIKCTEDEQK